MKMRKSLAAMVLLGTLVLSGVVQAQNMTFFRIGTGSAGGTYYPIGGLIANAISNPPGSRACARGGSCGVPGLVAIAQSTNASAHNVTAIQNGQIEAGLSGAATLYFAYHGEAKFQGKPKKKLRVVANLYPEALHLVLPKDNKLDSLKSLRGRRVGIAQAGSGTQIAVEIILKAYGLGRDSFTAAELNNSQSAERMADGQLDAYFYVAGTPVAAMIQLDATKGMELYSFAPDEIKAADAAVPYYVPSTIVAGTYPGVKYDVKTLAVNGILVTSADQPEALIYSITKALWNKNTRKLLDNGHAKGRAITRQNALRGLTALNVPLHPGAKRYYREAGMIN